MKRLFVFACITLSACGGGSATAPNSSTPPAVAATKVVSVAGDLAFGNVNLGETPTRTFTIGNSGNAALTFTGLNAIGGTGAAGFTTNITSGTVAPGATVTVTLRFTPTSAQFYSNVLTVAADQTSGNNAINVSGTGINTPPPPAANSVTVTGTVTEQGIGPLAGANVEVRDGPDGKKSTNTDASGKYALSGLQPGTFTLRAQKSGYVDTDQRLTVSAGTTPTVDFTVPRVPTPTPPAPTPPTPTPPTPTPPTPTPPTPTPPPPPPPSPSRVFGPGQYRVNTDIAPGRYFSVPSSGCYWERQSGFGGTLGDIIANDFVGYNPAHYIVDILSSDFGFETDSDCRTWFDTPRTGAQSSIPPGVWLVGSQIAPGTYQVSSGAGCYWERLSNFTHQLSGIIANDFSSDARTQFVTIAPGDVGFSNDGDCGTWTRTSGANIEAPSASNRLQSRGDVEHHWNRYRQKNAGRR